MAPQIFFDTLRTHIRRKPFLPFCVILKDGREIEIDDNEICAFDETGAGFIHEDLNVSYFESVDVEEIPRTSREAEFHASR